MGQLVRGFISPPSLTQPIDHKHGTSCGHPWRFAVNPGGALALSVGWFRLGGLVCEPTGAPWAHGALSGGQPFERVDAVTMFASSVYLAIEHNAM
eukprot:7387958-Pyramimonas_sp.AAC.1